MVGWVREMDRIEEEKEEDRRVAKEIVDSILDNGLANSTWKDNNPAAYEELLKYRLDLQHDVESILRKR